MMVMEGGGKETESQKLSFASHHIQTRISFVNQRNISGEKKSLLIFISFAYWKLIVQWNHFLFRQGEYIL